MPEVLAYVRQPTNGLADGVEAHWALTTDRQKVMQADHDDLVFADGWDREDAIIAFEAKYPVQQPGLNRMTFGHNSGIHANVPKDFTIFTYEWYSKADHVEICQMATAAPKGTGIVYEVNVTDYQSDSRWNGEQRWDHAKRRYIYGPDPLEEYGCYKRKIVRTLGGIEMTVREVVYNTKVTARRQKRREDRNNDVKKLPTAGTLLVADLDLVTRDLCDLLPSSSLLTKPGGWNDRRYGCLHDFRNAFRLVWMIYDRTAHRQSVAFQALLKKWRDGTRAEDTRKNWTNCSAEDVFKFLDEEAKKAKPRKRVLKASNVELPL